MNLVGYDKACRELEASRRQVAEGMRLIVRDCRLAHYEAMAREANQELAEREGK